MSRLVPHLAVLTALLFASFAGAETERFTLQSPQSLRPIKVATSPTTFDGKPALRVVEAPGAKGSEDDKLVIISGTKVQDGVIELSVSSRPADDAGPNARGFAGVAFRVNSDASRYECFYLRPTNGRANDQLRRNHSTQYVSHPEYPWHRLREETPGKYEAYVDLVPGDWTDLRIELEGETAKLFVHGSDQPTLIVNDLKHGVTEGQIALWMGPGTEAYFSEVSITK
ncbi:MAG: hypothetical protein AAGA81_18725 [Acidobacteriota bacterium]